MGLDMNLIMARNKKQIEKEGFWLNQIIDAERKEDFEYDKPAILVYWRKYWDLYNFLSQRHNLDNGEYVEINKEELEEIINFATHNPDYWDGFESVPSLCKVLYNYDKIRENGFRLFFEGDY